VDLQLAYLAAPASAAAANAAQQAPVAAQEAAQSAFVAQLEQREETIEQSSRAEGAKVQADQQGGNAGTYSPRKRRRGVVTSAVENDAVVSADEPAHFIDTTA